MSAKTQELSFLDDLTSKKELLKKTICKGTTDSEFELFLYACKRTGLDPFMKQIYAIKRGGAMTLQTSIDGFRLIAERTGRYAPGKETIINMTKDGDIESATSYVKKMTPDGTWHEVSATAYWNEYKQEFNGKLSQFWMKMPRLMLAKCAESLALRKAFPVELSGLYTHEEMTNSISEVMEDAQVEVKEEEVHFPIPEGEDKEMVSKYLEELAEEYNIAIPLLKTKILNNPNKFWETFKTWKLSKELDVA